MIGRLVLASAAATLTFHASNALRMPPWPGVAVTFGAVMLG